MFPLALHKHNSTGKQSPSHRYREFVICLRMSRVGRGAYRVRYQGAEVKRELEILAGAEWDAPVTSVDDAADWAGCGDCHCNRVLWVLG